MSNESKNPQQTSEELATVERGTAGSELVPFNLDPAKGKVTFWSSLKPVSAREKSLIYKAMTGDVPPLDGYIGELVQVSNFIFQGVDLVNPATGEVSQCVRVVLIDPDLKMIGCVSDGVRQSLVKAMAVFGPPPWIPAIVFTPKIVKTRRGFRTYILDLGVDDSQPEQPAQSPPAKPAQSAPKK